MTSHDPLTPEHRPHQPQRPSRRGFLAAAGLGALAGAGLPVFTASAAEPHRPAADPRVPEDRTLELWYPGPADSANMIQTALPVGNGRLGALVGGDPAADLLCITDGTMWTGGLNDTLDADGQFPYERVQFGSLTQLAHVTVAVPAHSADRISGYRRALDLSNGVATASYTLDNVTYRRETFASHPDNVVVLALTQSGGGTYTGTVDLAGTHGESVTATAAAASSANGARVTGTQAAGAGPLLAFAASFDNALSYAGAVTATATHGTVEITGTRVTFTDCADLTVVFGGGTDYAPDPDHGYRDPSAHPADLAAHTAHAAARHPASVLRATHVADHRRLFESLSLSLGTSDAHQRALDTPSRLAARAAAGAAPDPELESSYFHFGRYLLVAGSRDSVPLGLQGLWLDGNDPDWMGDYHTDINVEMNYWLPDRAGLPASFDAFTDYCLSQLPSWTDVTGRTFNDSRNRFRNSTGKVAGWAVAFSTNIHGGSGWWWHPAANAWLANTLFDHYAYTQDTRTLARIYPLLKGACEFWESRLITTTVDDPASPGGTREVLVDDKDWSPEQGPQDAVGNTYAQELVWALFGNYATATRVLGRDRAYARTVAGLRDRLYLPVVSPTTGWLEEWMSPDNLGEDQHRHLSPLIGLFPGDRIRPGETSEAVLTGVRNLLTARGMDSYGWANAWRALCWARLGEAETAYQLIATNLRPSEGNSNGTAPNLFDIYQVDAGRSIFQIDANFGTPAAITEMLVRSRPGQVDLLPALPGAWAASGHINGVGVRGGFVLDLSWRDGRVVTAVLRSVGGRTTTVSAHGRSRTVRLAPGASVPLHGLGDRS
ncbi:glycosyl hydrolase family 95 catalytic domain-containing protein [Streptomyces sp. NBC_01497]|uniref:glycosyl hydrolase family 95 catalytic domain-containing protein n=1 Tax=Streptomyces sp. NBC_01497 TaxID=2903885 RepID=UPI002E348697|nr:glycoside hydrolase N-terminal domain-containing protein [Streptomyces sp. NBC_01497]